MGEIIEDTISRNKKFQEERQRRVKRLKELKAPAIIIEHEEMIAKMTLAEYVIYKAEVEAEVEAENRRISAEYAKNNPIQKSIVDEIYLRESKLEYCIVTYLSDFHMITVIDPLSFMSKDDYDNDLYRSFLEHAKEIYRTRFKERFEADNND